MLYHLLYPLHELIPAFNVFRYITFRVAAAIVTALLLSWLLGPWFIRKLRSLSVGQNIRDVGPQAHQVKAGTPTMGGVLILFACLGATLLWGNLTNPYVWMVVLVTAAFGGIGFLDDYIKVRKRRSLGLTARAKMGLQILAAGLMGLALWLLPGFNSELTFPFLKRLVLDLGIFYIPFVVIVLVGASNAVNLTDGLDGLAIGTTSVAAATYAVFTYVAGNRVIAGYLQIAHVPGRWARWRSSAVPWSVPASASCGTTRTPPRSSWATSDRWRWARASAASRCWPSRRSCSCSSAACSSWRRSRSSFRWPRSSCAASGSSACRRSTITSS